MTCTWVYALSVAATCSALTALTPTMKVESLSVSPISRVTGTVTLPGSKSLSNRALLLAALSKGETVVKNVLASDDTDRMLAALPQLGVGVEDLGDYAVKIGGVGGALGVATGDEPLTLDLGNAGTAMRPLAAVLAAATSGDFVLDGTPRMCERPIEDLVEALKQLGCEIECTQNGDFGGCPPVRISAAAAPIDGGTCSVSGKTSSQFLSALLIASPLLARTKDVTIEIIDELISAPYVRLTIGLMAQFGVAVDFDDSLAKFVVKAGQSYVAPEGGYFVEGDASSASYFLAAAAMTGGPCTVVGCGSASTQGDVRFASVLEEMGATVEWTETSITVSRDSETVLRGVDVDCVDIPDAAMTLAAVALVAKGPTTIRNVGSWRVKETERMKAIVAETTKLGADVFEGAEHCVITPPPDNRPNADVEIETYDDHRIAMTFALASCAGVPVTILDPGCTAKTFPTYFDELERVATRP